MKSQRVRVGDKGKGMVRAEENWDEDGVASADREVVAGHPGSQFYPRLLE